MTLPLFVSLVLRLHMRLGLRWGVDPRLRLIVSGSLRLVMSLRLRLRARPGCCLPIHGSGADCSRRMVEFTGPGTGRESRTPMVLSCPLLAIGDCGAFMLRLVCSGFHMMVPFRQHLLL